MGYEDEYAMSFDTTRWDENGDPYMVRPTSNGAGKPTHGGFSGKPARLRPTTRAGFGQSKQFLGQGVGS